MKKLAALFFLIVPTLVFAQEREKSYEIEGYKFSKPPVEVMVNPDLKQFECDPVEELERKSPYAIGKEYIPAVEEQTIRVSVLMGVELFEYVAIENYGKDCQEKWTDMVVGYFKEYFEQNHIEMSVEELTSSFCLHSSTRTIQE